MIPSLAIKITFQCQTLIFSNRNVEKIMKKQDRKNQERKKTNERTKERMNE